VVVEPVAVVIGLEVVEQEDIETLTHLKHLDETQQLKHLG